MAMNYIQDIVDSFEKNLAHALLPFNLEGSGIFLLITLNTFSLPFYILIFFSNERIRYTINKNVIIHFSRDLESQIAYYCSQKMLPAFLYLCCCIGFKNTLCAFILFMAFNVEVTIIEIERSKKCSMNPWEYLFILGRQNFSH